MLICAVSTLQRSVAIEASCSDPLVAVGWLIFVKTALAVMLIDTDGQNGKYCFCAYQFG